MREKEAWSRITHHHPDGELVVCPVQDREAWRAATHGGHKESDTTERLNNTNSNNLCKMPHPILAIPFQPSPSSFRN